MTTPPSSEATMTATFIKHGDHVDTIETWTWSSVRSGS